MGLVALPAGIVLLLLARALPAVTERVYASGVYPYIARALSTVSGPIPFSIAEMAYAAVAAMLVAAPAVAAVRARRRGDRWPRAVLAATGRLIGDAGWIWCSFLLLWGLNYAREEPARLFGLERPLGAERRTELVDAIGDHLDRLRVTIDEDAAGVAALPADLGALDREIGSLQAAVLEDAGLPVVSRGRTKRVLSSPLLLASGVSGVYGPFTGEPNVVLPAAPCRLPFVIAHERAHLAGFAWEEAASFIALLTLWESDEPALAYAGWLSLWTELGGPAEGRAPGVQRDLAAMREFWSRHVDRGASRRFRRAYGTFLSAHGVEGGMASYGRAAELALRYLDERGMPGLEPGEPDAR